MKHPLACMFLIVFMTTSCSPLTSMLLGGLTHGGPQLNANVQAGKTNTEAATIGTTDASQQEVSHSSVGTVNQSHDSNKVSAKSVGTIIVNEAQSWKREYGYWLAIILALFLDSPRRWPEEIMNAFKRQRKASSK